jgi:chromosome segregation ATPase
MPVKKGSLKTGKGQGSEERIVHEFHIISEGLLSQVKQVAEGVANVDQKLDRTRLELKGEIEEKTQPITQAVVSLDNKVTTLDGKVNALDVKLDRFHQELKSEIQETRQEILAAVKFSYAELDKRLTTLEKEFLDLKHRVEKMESRSVS